jgi:Sigma-70 factor, region 1.1
MSEEPKLEELDRLISMGKQKGFLTYDELTSSRSTSSTTS